MMCTSQLHKFWRTILVDIRNVNKYLRNVLCILIVKYIAMDPNSDRLSYPP